VKVKVLKTVSAFGEIFHEGTIFEGNKKDFPKTIQVEIEYTSDCVSILENFEKEDKKQVQEILIEEKVEQVKESPKVVKEDEEKVIEEQVEKEPKVIQEKPKKKKTGVRKKRA
jgi:hypothetical protein